MSIWTSDDAAIATASDPVEPDRPRVDGERRVGLAILVVVILAGAIVRLWIGVRLDDIYWSDETYKSLEQAHRLVFGYGITPWEFTDGANNWAWPAVLAVIFKAASVLGLSQPSQYIGLARAALAAAGVGTAFAAFRLARSYGASTFSASSGAALFALAAPAIYFAPRALSETASTLPVALGLALALQPRARPRQVGVGASLLGVAVMLRFLNAFFAVALVVILIARRDRRAAATAGCTLVVWAILFGAIDWLTWGGWFHSAITYLRFNLVEGRASGWGTSPFGYYWHVLLGSFGIPAATLLVGLCLLSVRRAPGLFLTAATFVLAHSLVLHKEGRFLLPVLAVLCSLAAIGLEELGRLAGPLARRTGMAAVLVAITLSTVHLPDLTYADVGQSGFPQAESAYGRGAEATRLLLKAHTVPDLCGLRIEGITWVFTGGYTWLHRQVPLENPDGNLRNPGVFNYVIAPADKAPAGDVVARDNGWTLTRLPGGGCPAGPPEWSKPTSVTY